MKSAGFWEMLELEGQTSMREALQICYPESDYLPIAVPEALGFLAVACWTGRHRDQISLVNLVSNPGKEVMATAASLEDLAVSAMRLLH